MPDVGIVMPVYIQEPAFLTAAIRSILIQTYSEFRFVIVIDGAPEMLEHVRTASSGDSRIEIVSNPDNLGVAGALNRGFFELLHDPRIHYLTWVSSDNIYYPEYVRILRRTLHEGPESLGIAYSSFQSIDDEGHPLKDEQYLALLRQYQAKSKEALLNESIIGVSFMYKAQYARKTTGYLLEPVEDYEFFLRLAELCDIKYIPTELMEYRVDSRHSISSQLKSAQDHQRWRHAFHTAKHQSRVRQGIPLELTVVMFAEAPFSELTERIEGLYEQYFSNYSFLFVDLSPDESLAAPVMSISHPTTEFRTLPGIPFSDAFPFLLQFIAAPFVLLIGTPPFGSNLDLEVLVSELRKAPPEIFGCHYSDNRSGLVFLDWVTADDLKEQVVYRTDCLKRVFLPTTV